MHAPCRLHAPVLVALQTLALACAQPQSPAAPGPVAVTDRSSQPSARVTDALAHPASQEVPRRVILFIGDGTGLSYWSALRYHEPLNVERMDEVGLVDTRPADTAGNLTDSAAGATAFASGVRTYNGAIGVGPDSQAVQTVLERARQLGMATGLVATSSITHATPAAFAAHVVSRSMNPEIASQMAEAGVDVLLGGGLGYFDGSLRPDSTSLMPRLRDRYVVVDDAAGLHRAAAGAERLLGLFAQDAMPVAARRAPTLVEMTAAALRVLDRDPDGFFLMVEGSQIDWRGHDNEPIELVLDEVRDLDHAIGAALDYAERNPGTLVLVTADHETGGLALHPRPGTGYRGDIAAHYTTTGHTGEMVPLFAHGPGAERFGRVLDNDEVGRRLRALIEARSTP